VSTATEAEPDLLTGDIDRARTDPGFWRRFAAAYEGPGDAGDALFWLGHPHEQSPSGALPEAARIRELRRAVYASPEGAALAPELRRLQRSADERHSAALQAFTAAAGPDPAAAPFPAAPPAPRRLVLRLPRRAVLLTACALVAAGLGAVVGAATGAPTASRAQPRFTQQVVLSTHGVEELSRPWRPADRVTVTFGPSILPGSVRRLGGYPDGETSIYGARDRFGHVCLLAAAIYYESACAPDDRFGTAGIALTWTLDSTPPWRPAETGVAVWRPDGRLLLGRALP
jgi:hypothetical protein